MAFLTWSDPPDLDHLNATNTKCCKRTHADSANFNSLLVRARSQTTARRPRVMRTKPTNEEPLTCRIVTTNDEFVGKHWLRYRPGISAESAGATSIHLQTVVLPPGAYANPHKHAAHETAIYVLSGVSDMWYGTDLTEHLTVR